VWNYFVEYYFCRIFLFSRHPINRKIIVYRRCFDWLLRRRQIFDTSALLSLKQKWREYKNEIEMNLATKKRNFLKRKKLNPPICWPRKKEKDLSGDWRPLESSQLLYKKKDKWGKCQREKDGQTDLERTIFSYKRKKSNLSSSVKRKKIYEKKALKNHGLFKNLASYFLIENSLKVFRSKGLK